MSCVKLQPRPIMPFDQWMLQVDALGKAEGFTKLMETNWEMHYWRMLHADGLTPREAWHK